VAHCKYCGRSGLFLKVTRNGLCLSCDPVVMRCIVRHVQIMDESQDLVANSKKLETRLGRCQTIVDQARMLLEYDRKGIPTITPSPDQIIRVFTEKADAVIVDSLEKESEAARLKSNAAATANARVNHLTRVLLRIRSFQPQLQQHGLLDPLEARLLDAINHIQLENYLTQARKAEFKGQPKKALDAYYEALYFLRHDDIDDSMQTDHITAIQDKILSLGGQLA
jgi:hypothetical protein